MKKILLLFFIGSITFSTAAQEAKESTYYFSDGLSLGNYLGVDFSLNYVIKQNYAVRFGFSGNIRKPESQPEDYSGGLNGLFSAGASNPYDHFLSYHLDFGKIYDLNAKGTIRANISVGLGYMIIKEPANWQHNASESVIDFSENYSYSYRSYSTIGVVINPKLELPFSKYFGISVSPVVQLNKDRIYYGIGLGTMLGKLR